MTALYVYSSLIDKCTNLYLETVSSYAFNYASHFCVSIHRFVHALISLLDINRKFYLVYVYSTFWQVIYSLFFCFFFFYWFCSFRKTDHNIKHMYPFRRTLAIFRHCFLLSNAQVLKSRNVFSYRSLGSEKARQKLLAKGFVLYAVVVGCDGATVSKEADMFIATTTTTIASVPKELP